MPCQTPYRDDSAQLLLYKIASCIEAGGGGGGGSGVTSFNLRTGAVTLTSGDVTGALGFTPLSQTTGDARYVLKTGDTMTGALAIGNGVLVASTPYLNLSQTWNNAAVTFTALQSNVTNTASNANSNLFNFQVDGSDRFNFTSGGTLRAIRQDASDSGVNFFLRKRGNAGGATNAVASDSTIGAIQFSGWDGTAFATGAHIDGITEEAWTNVAHGSRINFYTVPSGSTSDQITLRLSSTGQAQLLAGTAALPALTFQGDTDTGIYRIGANSFGSSAGGSLILATSTTGINLTTALAYQYNGVNVIRAQTALSNYFFGPSGNLTMTGTFNFAMGVNALFSNTTGFFNTAIGASALLSNTVGTSNSAIGVNSLLSNISGVNNSAIGASALQSNTTGGSNSAIGVGALQTNTTGVNNSAIGVNALFSNTTANSNSAIGVSALLFNSTGASNSAIGASALQSNTTGASNCAVGASALQSNTTGTSNSAIGVSALFNLTTGSQNTAVGSNTGLGITTGGNNTIIGANVAGLAAALANNIILADGAGVIRLQINSSGNTTLAGTVQTAAGTAALPAYSFTADPNTGLYNIGADSLGFSTGGTLRTTTNTTDLILSTAFRLAFESGANQRAGNAVLVGGTVTVANTSVTANTIVLLTRKTSGGTIGTAITYTTIAATSFTINSDSVIDTSTFSYMLLEVP